MTDITRIIDKVVENEHEIVQTLQSIISDISTSAIHERDVFYMGLSGGSVIKFLTECLERLNTDWTKWKFFFCDERILPESSSDNTFAMYKKLFDLLPITRENFAIVNTSLSVEEAAIDYEKQMKECFPNDTLPKFDLLLLGMGPDGHTASLFPGHKLLDEKTRWIAPISDSPKPPPCRVTMTYPVINNAKNCLIVAAGAGKADMVKRVLIDEDRSLPITRVKPIGGQLFWILDKAAGAKL